MIDVLLIWVMYFGMFPLAAPGHDVSSLLAVIDIALHFGALLWLCWRWRISIERRVTP